MIASPDNVNSILNVIFSTNNQYLKTLSETEIYRYRRIHLLDAVLLYYRSNFF